MLLAGTTVVLESSRMVAGVSGNFLVVYSVALVALLPEASLMAMYHIIDSESSEGRRLDGIRNNTDDFSRHDRFRVVFGQRSAVSLIPAKLLTMLTV